MYTLSTELWRTVEDEHHLVSTLFQMYSVPSQGKSNAKQFFGHFPPALDFQAALER